MELLKVLAEVYFVAAGIVVLIILLGAWHEHAKGKRNERRQRELDKAKRDEHYRILNHPEVVHARSVASRALHATLTLRELGLDAHKRIDDNRKLMLLIEAYNDQRMTDLEDRLAVVEKGKRKC